MKGNFKHATVSKSNVKQNSIIMHEFKNSIFPIYIGGFTPSSSGKIHSRVLYGFIKTINLPSAYERASNSPGILVSMTCPYLARVGFVVTPLRMMSLRSECAALLTDTSDRSLFRNAFLVATITCGCFVSARAQTRPGNSAIARSSVYSTDALGTADPACCASRLPLIAMASSRASSRISRTRSASAT